ncbi:MAG: S41 family peptidase [Bacteroidota bacterium]
MKKHFFSKHYLHCVFIVSLLLIGTLATGKHQDKHFKLSKNLEVLAHVLKELDAYYVHDIDYDDLLETGIHAMLQSLDPYTSFIPEESSASFKTLTTGAYEGIGAVIGTRQHKNLVFMLYKDAPAYKGGLRVGDEIIQVDGEDVCNKPIEQVSSLLRGEPNTTVRATVARYACPQPLELTLTRDKVTLKNVLYSGQIKQGIGYIKLANFTTQVSDEVKVAIKALKNSGAQKLILDLRGNPGGVLEEAVKVVNLFLDKGLQVVETKSRLENIANTYRTEQAAYDSQIPLVVLIDQGSASAAEIVAGVIQDYDRGILIGKKTYGKGLVQAVRPLRYQAQLKVTTAQYYIPSGRSIQKVSYQQQRGTQQATELADELKGMFKTKQGRTVYEGDGITPDLEIDKLSLSPITTSLLVQGLIFDYTTVFCAKHDTIAPAQDFRLSEAQYQDFIAWLADKEYPYTIETSLDQLSAQAQNEAYPEDIQTQIVALKLQVQHQKEADLQTYSEEIKLILQESVAGRYYFQEGTIEAMLTHDQAIQKACTLLDDMDQYQAMLQPS